MAKKRTKKPLITREQIARIIFRTMRIEEPSMTHTIAKKAAAKVRLGR